MEIENSLRGTQSRKLIITQEMMKENVEIIASCDETLKQVNLSPPSPEKMKSKHSHALTNAEHQQLVNIQQQEQIKKELKKIKKQKKRISNVCSIKKTDLGENQLTFTETQMKKLAIMDEFLEKGFQIPDFNMLEEGFQNKTNDEYVPLQEKDHKGELEKFSKWGQSGNRDLIYKNLDDDVIDKMEKVRIEVQQKNKKQKKEFSKTINFQKNYSKSLNKGSGPGQRNSVNGMNVLLGKRESLNSGFKRMGATALSNFSHKNTNQTEKKKFPLVLKLQQKAKKQQLRVLRNKEKLDKLTKDLSEKYVDIPKSVYMTKQRHQGLYECEMIKKARGILGKKDYNNLFMMIGCEISPNEENSEECQPHPLPQHQNILIDGGIRKPSNRDIDGILALNRKRLKLQRQRIITKLHC